LSEAGEFRGAEAKASVQAERALLVGVVLRNNQQQFDDLQELTSLIQTAGAQVVGKVIQRRSRIDSAFYIGKGKAGQLAELVEQHKAEIVVFDNDLSPAQVRDLEKIINRKVIDRSELILDIFATRAKTRQARLQVELAQLQYTYPRLRHMWTHLERIAGVGGGGSVGMVGGIGTRGPGETQIETDRRLVRRRIDILRGQLKSIDKRKLREIKGRSDFFTISIVGYTNAGKSTLINALTGSGLYVEDKLFATLDTRTRRWELGRGRVALLSDTIGFVRDLPHHLIASFRATLEETIHADLLINVIDASDLRAEYQVRTVQSVLKDLGCADKPTITVFNKIDMVQDDGVLGVLRQVCGGDGLAISAASGQGLDLLAQRACRYYHQPAVHLTVELSCTAGKLISFLQQHADIHQQRYIEDRMQIDLTISRGWIGPMMKFGGLLEVLACSDPQVLELINGDR